MSNFAYYTFALIVMIVGLMILKKVATCMVKMVVAFIMIAILLGVYWLYF